MKRKVLLILLLVPLLLSVTACGKKVKTETQIANLKSIILEDTNKGYKTTFKYPVEDNYTNLKEETGGASTEITFENEDLDIEFQMYYNTVPKVSYEDGKKNRSEQKYFKEYKLGSYESYVYGESSSGLYLVVKLDDNDEKNTVLLFVSMDRLDSNEDVVIADVFADKNLQDFFNSIEFERK